MITDRGVKENLVPLSWGQRQLADASHVVVFAVKHPISPKDVRRHVERTAPVRDRSVEEFAGFENVVNDFLENPPGSLDIKGWASRQVYVALGNFMTSAALLGVDTCPMEGLDPAGYDEAIGLVGSGYWTVAACPAGYRRPKTITRLLQKSDLRKKKSLLTCHESRTKNCYSPRSRRHPAACHV